MILAVAALAALFVSAPSIDGVPAGSFSLQGFTRDLTIVATPALVLGERAEALVAFQAPLEGNCAVIAVVSADGRHKAIPLPRDDGNFDGDGEVAFEQPQFRVHAGEARFERAVLPSAADLAHAGATSDGYTVAVACAITGEKSSMKYSNLYHAAASAAAQ
jgi:hypothetical protein